MNASRLFCLTTVLGALLWLPLAAFAAGDEHAAGAEPAAEAGEGHVAEGHALADGHAAADGHALSDEHAAGDHAEHPTGVPLEFRADLALWSLVTFVLFVIILRVFAWGKLVTGLDSREAGIRQNIADAEAARLSSERMLREHETKLAAVQEEVKAILAEARSDAEQTRHSIVTEAQAEAEASRKRAIDDIERARDQALKELFDSMASQVVGATEYVVGHSLNPQDQDRLVREALEQVRPHSKV